MLSSDKSAMVPTWLVGSASQDKEQVLQETDIVVLKEGVRNLAITFGKVGHKVDANTESNFSNITHSVLERPNNRVHQHLELRLSQNQDSYKKIERH